MIKAALIAVIVSVTVFSYIAVVWYLQRARTKKERAARRRHYYAARAERVHSS